MKPGAPPKTSQARDLHRSGRLDEAEVIYRALLEREPDNTDVLVGLGTLRFQRDDPVGAIPFLEKAVALGVSPETLRDTPNFDALGNNPRFQALIQNTQKK